MTFVPPGEQKVVAPLKEAQGVYERKLRFRARGHLKTYVQVMEREAVHWTDYQVQQVHEKVGWSPKEREELLEVVKHTVCYLDAFAARCFDPAPNQHLYGAKTMAYLHHQQQGMEKKYKGIYKAAQDS